MLITLLILAGLPFLLSVNSVLSTDDEFFVISEDVYYDLADYGLKPSLSPVAEKFGNVYGSYKENDGQFVDS